MTRFIAALLLSVVSFHAAFAHAQDLPRFQLHLYADSAVKLQRHTNAVADNLGIFKEWDDVCAAPCDQAVDRKGVYRLGGEGLIPSDPLAIPPGDRIEIAAKVGSVSARTTGIVLEALAGASVVAAVIAADVSVALMTPPNYGAATYNAPTPDVGWLIVSGVLLTGAITACAIGLPMLIGNKTRVELNGSSSQDFARR